MSTAYSKYVPHHERPIVTSLSKWFLNRGYKLAIHNGEEWETKRTTKWHSLRPGFGSTGEDRLVVWDSEGNRVGSWLLIYNNGSEHDPLVVISDYGWADDDAGELFESAYRYLEMKYGD